MEADRVGAHGVQDAAHEIQVMEGLCPQWATELQMGTGTDTGSSGPGGAPAGVPRLMPVPRLVLTWCRCPQCSHSGLTGGPQAAENLTL